MSYGYYDRKFSKKYGLSREEQDEFALNSQLKAAKAIENKAFETEILPLKIQDKKREFLFSEYEFVRKDANLEALSRLKPTFDKNGTVTAGNSSGVNDGATMLLLSSKEKALELNLPILATLKGFASVSVEPSIMGIGAAFTAQSLATLKTNANRVNINGGAIALGHLIGASGARILTSLIYALRARGKNLGLATLCVGGGQWGF